MRVLILNTHVPFIRGGAEVLAEGLRDAVRAAGHQAEIVAVPFNGDARSNLSEQILACRLLDLTSFAGASIDRVIGLKFPAYFARHPNKVTWLLHQHVQAYHLWEEPWGDLIQFPGGAVVRDLIHHADRELLPESRAIYTISGVVSRRLKEYCELDGTPLYPPVPNDHIFTCASAEDYLFFPSRVSASKRQALVLEALAKTSQPVILRLVGRADRDSDRERIQGLIGSLRLEGRVHWTGEVSEEEKLRLYAHALGVVFPPLDEDYGYITAEAMLSSKPVITCSDSGAPLELVVPGETGFVVEPTPDALADAMDRLWSDRPRAASMGRAGRERYGRLGITWPRVAETLLA